MKDGLKIYQKEIFNDDLKRKEKRLRTVVENNKNSFYEFFENGGYLIIPAATVSLVASSTRINDPVTRF